MKLYLCILIIFNCVFSALVFGEEIPLDSEREVNPVREPHFLTAYADDSIKSPPVLLYTTWTSSAASSNGVNIERKDTDIKESGRNEITEFIEKIKNKVKELHEINQNLLDGIEKKDKEIAELQYKLATYESNLKSRVKELLEKVKVKEQEIRKLEREKQDMETKLKEGENLSISEEMQKLKTDLDNKDKEITKIKGERSLDKKSSQEAITELLEKITNKDKEITDLKAEVKNAVSKKQTAETKLLEVENKMGAAEIANNIDAYKAEIEKLKNEYTQEKLSLIEERDKLVKDLKDKDNEIMRIKEIKEKDLSEREDDSKKCSELEKKAKELEEEIKLKDKTIVEFKEAYLKERNDFQEEIAKLIKDQDLKDKQLNDLKDLDEKVKNIISENEALQKELSEKGHIFSEGGDQKQIKELTDKSSLGDKEGINSNNEELSKLRDTIVDKDKKIKERDEEIRQLKAAIQKTLEYIDGLSASRLITGD